MTIWLTADTHFYHKNVIAYCNRPYDSVKDMNEALVNNWNECVKPDDFVYHLGDFALGNVRKLSDIRARLNGNIIFILGNHDLSVSKNKWLNDVGMSEACLHSSLDDFWLYHYPREDECVDDSKKPLKRPPNDGRWALTGHVHEKWRIKNKCLNVGVDVHDYKPVSLARCKEIIKEYEDLL